MIGVSWSHGDWIYPLDLTMDPIFVKFLVRKWRFSLQFLMYFIGEPFVMLRCLRL